jgi:hypothetical protein
MMDFDALKGKNYSIFGVGDNAKKLYFYLKEYVTSPNYFIVSNGYRTIDSFDSVMVLELDGYQRIDEIVLVAIDKKYKEDVIATLNNKGIDYYFVEEDDYKTIFRKTHVWSTIDFLNSNKPVSCVFGIDRGKPIDRYYIESFLKNEVKIIEKADDIIEVGEINYSQTIFPNSNHHVLDYGMGMDLTRTESLKKDYYNVFVCTQVFNFIYDVKSAIEGSYYILKNNGTLLATVAGNISQVSRYDMDRWGDYWRFTFKSIDMLIREVFGDDVKIVSYGNAMAATAFVQGLSVEDVDENLLDYSDPDYSIVLGIVAVKHEENIID